MEVENIVNKEEAPKEEIKTMKVEFLKDHGTSKKGDEKEMPISTADALIVHKVVKSLEVKTKEKKG